MFLRGPSSSSETPATRSPCVRRLKAATPSSVRSAQPASPLREVTLLSAATRTLVSAMKAEQVSRLICITGIGAGDSAGHGGFLFDNVIFPLLLRNVLRRQEPAGSDRQGKRPRLEFSFAPPMLNDKPGRDSIRALTDLSGFHGGTISREDVARFVLDQLRADAWLHRSPLITW